MKMIFREVEKDLKFSEYFIREFTNVNEIGYLSRLLIENSSGDYRCWNEFDNVFEIE